jgi:beta-1,4-mannosyl-glycoprotein beta-1,4-N-acetylglucosaminyltransferase
MNISLICACKNRSNALRVSLSSWLLFDYVKEIIIVDWSSDEPINYLTKLDSRIKVIRVEDQKYFNQPQPLNLAIQMATGDYILKVDTDYLLNPYENFFEKYLVDEKSFISGKHNIKSPEYIDPKTGLSMIDTASMNLEDWTNYFNSYCQFFKFLTGLLFVSKKNLEAIGGYNESLTKYYAFEDDEVTKRLELYGLEHKKISYDYNVIHLPHADKKRFENFRGFDGSIEKKYLNSLSEGEQKWQYEYHISQKHIENNRKMCAEIVNYYVKPKTKWNIMKIDDQNYFAEKVISDKLVDFPSVYYVSLEESQERRDNLESQFGFYNIVPKAIISKRFSESKDVAYGKYIDSLNEGTTGCVISHLKAIREWYETTDEDYGFFCEDDLSLETVECWDFNWQEFVESIPEDAECVQLFTIREKYDTFEIRERQWDDWGATAYIITRDYAKKVIDTYIKNDQYCLEIPNQSVMPLIENILFASVGKTYTIPLFVEEVKFQSTFVGKDDDVNDGQKKNHYIAHDKVLQWWKNKVKDDRIVEQAKSIPPQNIEEDMNKFSKSTNHNVVESVKLHETFKEKKKYNIVDCFPYFNEKELLELRVKLLKNHVDLFLIFDANYTHSGIPKDYSCNRVIDALGLPKDKIKVVEVDLSEPGEPSIYDLHFDSSQTIGSRERIQRDYLTKLLPEFDDDTLFIVSDCDEIINPSNIKFISDIARNNKDYVFKVPLVHLEGRADFRVYNLDGTPSSWSKSMFVAFKHHLEKNPPTYIRSEFMRKDYEIRYVTHNNEVCQDLGWHFSWMGTNQDRINKFKSFCHYNDDLSKLLGKDYSDQELWEYMSKYEFDEGNISPCGNTKTILKPYPFSELPSLIFSLPRVEQFLIPDILEIKKSKNDELNELLISYSMDTENPENNFNWGMWYEKEGHTAPSVSYYLRSAERSEDKNLAYESLIRASFCYTKQGTRDGSSKSLLEQAMCLLPERPEAYFLLSRFAERRQWWQDCYINADRALKYCDFELPPLKTDVEYPGKYGLLFEKAVAAWWWGKVDEAKSLLLDIKNNYEILDIHKKQLEDNLEKMKVLVN